ncbi:uncharacterized protein LOC111003520 isoform X6 [Pieris rapae]|uniref:uncharacterized protein LOC111003520 isoform X6 n=1 Tax=Pieris rapae TaxID=64459 RepID=UPI000B929510|nr:uncharacterized protein LOC111003520 isoform X6 [Pieris rapae]
MVLEDCQVVFNNYKGYFYSGDIVTGSVIFGLKHSGVVKGLVLNVKGTSKARWTRPMPTMPHIKVYSEKIEVLRLDISIDTQEKYLYELSKSFGKCKQYQLRIKTYNGIGSNQRAIPFEAYITNEKRIKVSKIVISLLQKLEYTVTSGYYNAEKKIHEFFLKDFKNDLEETCKLLIDIPPVVPSTINLERTLIKISYVYKVITVFFRFHFSMTMEIPVVIGSTPVIFTK